MTIALAQPRTERIDGTDYIVGSADHRFAIRDRDARLDAAFLEANHHHAEEWMRFLRDWPGFKHRNDANLVAFFGEQLVFMRARVERKLHERLRIREFLQVESGYPRGAPAYGQQVDDIVGDAKISTSTADDAATVDVESEVSFSPFVYAHAEYVWTANELDAAAYAGVPLLQRKAEAVADAIARKLEVLGRSGSAPHGLEGFLNSSGVTIHTLTNGEHTSTATPAEILADLAEIEATIVAVGGDNTPDEYCLLVPTTLDAKYRLTPINSTSDVSIAQWFTANSRRIKRIVPYGYLDDAVSPSIAAADAPMSMAMPVRPGTTLTELEHVLWPESVPYEELEPVQDGYRFRRRAQARVGGVDFRHPKFFLYVQNND